MLSTCNRVDEVGMRDVNRYLEAGWLLLAITNYAKAAKRIDGQLYTHKGVKYVVGWDGVESPPSMELNTETY